MSDNSINYLISPEGTIGTFAGPEKNKMRANGWENSTYEAYQAQQAPAKAVKVEASPEPEAKKLAAKKKKG